MDNVQAGEAGKYAVTVSNSLDAYNVAAKALAPDSAPVGHEQRGDAESNAAEPVRPLSRAGQGARLQHSTGAKSRRSSPRGPSTTWEMWSKTMVARRDRS